MNWLSILFALVAGAANPFQSGANAELRSRLGGTLWATAWVYLSGLAGVMLAQLLVREPMPAGSSAASTPWWAWTGGVISIVATVAGLTLAQRLGSGVFTGLSISASLLVSIILDHFGLLGLKQHPVTPGRLIGEALMIGGVWLVARS